MSLKLANASIGILKVLTGYASEAFYFGVAHPIRRNRTVEIISGTRSTGVVTMPGDTPYVSPIFTSCREVFTSSMRRLIAGMCVETMKTDKIRMLIWHKHRRSGHNNTSGGKNVLKAFNIIEKEKGWKPSRLYKVKTNVKEKPHLPVDCYLFIGPRQWISSPYMASLYALLTRIILKRSLVVKDGYKNLIFDDLEDLTRKIKSTRLVDAAKLYSKKNENSNWRVIIDNYEKLHKGGVNFRWLDCVNRAGSQDIRYQAKIHRLFSDGPDSLINNVSYNNKMQKRYNRLLV